MRQQRRMRLIVFAYLSHDHPIGFSLRSQHLCVSFIGNAIGFVCFMLEMEGDLGYYYAILFKEECFHK